MPETTPRRIEILGFPDAQLLDMTGPAQVFATANDLWPEGAASPYEIAIVSAEPEIVTTAGIALGAEPLPGPEIGVHTVIVSGGRGIGAACESPVLLDWITTRSARAARTASVCSGTFLLAQAGLLDGKRAVTHWERCAAFAARFPRVRLEPDPIFVTDGDIWSSAGITAGIDLALAMVEADLGRAHALAVARQLVVFLKRPGGQSQFSVLLGLQGQDARFDRLHAWIAANLKADLSLATLADRAGMSLRSFARHYRHATGQTPVRAVEIIRLETARRLLEAGKPISRAWRACGFGSEETMRRAFHRQLGVSPQAYRERFSR